MTQVLVLREGVEPLVTNDPGMHVSIAGTLFTNRALRSKDRTFNFDCIPPSNDDLAVIFKDLRSLLFPGYLNNDEPSEKKTPDSLREDIDLISNMVREQVLCSLTFTSCMGLDTSTSNDMEERASALTDSFVLQLPHIQKMLATDVIAHYEGDPAARSPVETILCYPGMQAIISYRIAHELFLLDIPLIPRMISELAHSQTGIDIHPGAKIGEGLFIDHGTGIVIGETCIIGNNVRIYQGVTLGAKSFPLDENGNPLKGMIRHPIVEDDVIIYSGSTLLGRIVIGKGSTIGGNVWQTHDVPPHSFITQSKARLEVFDNGAGV